jgi:hypothetical protein
MCALQPNHAIELADVHIGYYISALQNSRSSFGSEVLHMETETCEGTGDTVQLATSH